MSKLAVKMPLKPPVFTFESFFWLLSSNADIRVKTLSTSEDEGMRCSDDNFSMSKREKKIIYQQAK